MRKYRRLGLLITGLVLALVACTPPAPALPAEVPELPFSDNPDPTLCGIPTPWGSDEPAWLTGYYEGQLIQPTVYLYDSHLRNEVTGAASDGAEVRILLYQSNPELDYYLVETVDGYGQQGWVPAPFLSFEQPD
jgi:hypothetical protein